MADVTGTLHRDFGGKTYGLRLTMRDIAKLQDRHGLDLGGVLTGKSLDVIHFGLPLDVVALALMRGSKLSADDAAEISDELMTADQTIFAQLMEAVFPSAGKAADAGAGGPSGNAPLPGAAGS